MTEINASPTQTSMDLADHLDVVQNSTRPVVVLTGATGGIGTAVAHELAGDYLVVAQGRDITKLEKLAAGSDSILPVQADLTDEDHVGQFGRLPRVDALVNLAAIAPRFSLEDAEAMVWEEVFAVNVTAPAELTRVLLPQLRASEGTVVFLGSGASRMPAPNNVVYAASKHALQAVADSLRISVEADRVRVATVAPGFTDTPMVQWEDEYPLILPEVLIQPPTVARSIRHVIEAPADAQITEVWVRPRKEVR